MKKLIFVSLVILGAPISFAGESNLDEPRLVGDRFDKLYVPKGYDSNDQVQIVGEGLFPTSCYRSGAPKVNVDRKRKIIRVTPTAYVYDGPCVQVFVKYNVVIDLGILPAGEFKIVQNQELEQSSLIQIKRARATTPDDHLYAPVNQAFLSKNEAKLVLSLTGVFLNNCMDMDRVLVENEGEVLVVQPIAYFDSDDHCEEGEFPFKINREIKISVPKGRYLLHVRSSNGKAVNNVIEVL